jgi:type VII secretion protein EssB
MSTGTTFELDGVVCVLDKGAPEWTVALRRSLVRARDVAELDLLSHTDDRLLPCRVTADDDTVTLHLAPPDGVIGWDEVVRRPRADRLRALMNAGACAGLADRGYAVLLHPANIVVDRNLRPLLAYRGLAGAMPPRHDPAHLLRQLQALTLSTMDPRASFTELLAGAMTLRRASGFERSVISATSTGELVDLLAGLHDRAVAAAASELVTVPRRSHAVAKHGAVWFGVAAVVAGALAVVSTFVTAPFQERMLEADRRFLSLDYDGVIETLRPVAADDLPQAQRYELAHAFLRGTNLSDAQRTAVENNLSLSADPDYLTYWVHTGRGELDEALDLAKGLDEVDLVLYALTLQQEQTRASSALDGTAREQALEELQAEYDKYLAARTSALAAGASTVGDGDPADATAPQEPGGGATSDGSGE